MNTKQFQNENDLSCASREKFDAPQCEPCVLSDAILSAVVMQKGEAEAGEIVANSPERLRDYTILKGINSYAALGRYYLTHETSVPEELYQGMTERQFAKKKSIHYMTIHNRKISILHKLKKILENEKTWCKSDSHRLRE